MLFRGLFVGKSQKLTNNASKQKEEVSSLNRAIKIRENYGKLRNQNCISGNSYASTLTHETTLASLCESA